MQIGPIGPNPSQIAKVNLSQEQNRTQQSGNTPSFGKAVEQALHNINNMQVKANDGMTQLASGEPVELHDVLIAAEEASISLQLALQVRNKVIEAYQEISRMQV